MLTNGKIRLRAPEPLDADFMYEVENDTSAWRYGDTVAPLSRRILRDYAMNYDADPFASGQLRMIVTENETDTPVGIVDLFDISRLHRRGMTGIYILPQYRAKGYALLALSALRRYAREALHLHQLTALVEPDNGVSLALFRKAGFETSATLSDWLARPDGSFTDVCLLRAVL
jgi:diamine N-acetyltransferase